MYCLFCGTSLPEKAPFCSKCGQLTCSFTGKREVAYGAKGAYFYGSFTNGTACSNSVFGDPASQVAKTSYYQE